VVNVFAEPSVWTDPVRQIALSAGLSFEFNDAGEFRYLGIEVSAANPRYGEFDRGDAIKKFVGYLRLQFFDQDGNGAAIA